ncbi:OLC1v1033825C1 [Oldenlandia corymbosa var. corymbosa]|uniref:OLC1v1033825C1 n=1 Tax=Oldenlandia corymbosa var. corymbosa TaxID=529605 RepID=A0AAV1CP91_OLDCO|nr:OLC1v1033825C1 [Oldenlandia corymbosa var. corymbosa]
MGRGRGKGKKLNAAAREDAGSGEEEKLPVRRRGRPQKPLKDDLEEEEDVEKIEEEDDSESAKSSVLNKEGKSQAGPDNGRKRKRPSSQVKESLDSVKEENGNKNNTDAMKTTGFRQNGSRRKNKPRRAAEVGVECK